MSLFSRHNVTFEFALNRYLRTENMVNYVKELRYVRGSTNTGGGIEMLREQLFTKKSGDRKDVPNIALVITDGELSLLTLGPLVLSSIINKKNAYKS